jgi:biotin synthase
MRETKPTLRHDWTTDEIVKLYALPFADLMWAAQQVHRAHFSANQVQLSQLLSIKTGACAEDCSYCPQSARYDTGLEPEKLMPVDEVRKQARAAKEAGAQRYCLGAAWRSPKDKDLDVVCEMVGAIKSEGLEACVTLGMLTGPQAKRLKAAGLDYYNHNIDTSPEFYKEIITTRTFDDRIDTIGHVRDAGIHVCCGGIVGMGESRTDRAEMIRVLAEMRPHPESVPVNRLVKVKGTPLAQVDDVDDFEFVRTIAVARIVLPETMVRLSAGREAMDESLQALCFLAGANSIFYGEKLLTTANPGLSRDKRLLAKLGMEPLGGADVVESGPPPRASSPSRTGAQPA